MSFENIKWIWKNGEITGKIQKTFFDAVAGRDLRFLKWLHPVEQLVTA